MADPHECRNNVHDAISAPYGPQVCCNRCPKSGCTVKVFWGSMNEHLHECHTDRFNLFGNKVIQFPGKEGPVV